MRIFFVLLFALCFAFFMLPQPTHAYRPKSFADEVKRQQGAANGKYQWPASVDYSQAPDWCRELAGEGYFGWYWEIPGNVGATIQVFTRMVVLQIERLGADCKGLARFVVAPASETGARWQAFYQWGGDKPTISITPDGMATFDDSSGRSLYYRMTLDLKRLVANYTGITYGEVASASKVERISLISEPTLPAREALNSHWLVGAWSGSFPDTKNPIRALEVDIVTGEGVKGRWGLGIGRTGEVKVTLSGDDVEVVTQAASRVVLKRVDDDTLVGQFILKDGRSMPISLKRQ